MPKTVFGTSWKYFAILQLLHVFSIILLFTLSLHCFHMLLEQSWATINCDIFSH